MTDQDKTACVTLAAQIEGPDADEPTLIPHSELRRLLKEKCIGPYSPDVIEFALIFRIDGKFHQWDREGCAFLRRSFKERYITIDIFVPIAQWKGKTERAIRKTFAADVREALMKCIERLRKDKTEVDGDRLMADFDEVEKEYLRPIR